MATKKDCQTQPTWHRLRVDVVSDDRLQFRPRPVTENQTQVVRNRVCNRSIQVYHLPTIVLTLYDKLRSNRYKRANLLTYQ